MIFRKDKTSTGSVVRIWHPSHRRSCLIFCAAIFVTLTLLLVLAGLRSTLSLLLAFDIAVITYLAATIRMFVRSDAQSVRQRARTEDESYWGFLLSSVAVAAVMLVALAGELQTSKHANSLYILLAVGSLILAWLFINTVFTLHYAHSFYGDEGSPNTGLDFPGNADPDYWDFVYFAFVIGTAFEVSDVQIRSRAIRRVVLAHAMIAFFFNVIVIAFSVNIVAATM